MKELFTSSNSWTNEKDQKIIRIKYVKGIVAYVLISLICSLFFWNSMIFWLGITLH